jgi:hypothetical protein
MWPVAGSLNLKRTIIAFVTANLLLFNLWLCRHVWLSEFTTPDLFSNNLQAASTLLDNQHHQEQQESSALPATSWLSSNINVFSPPLNNATFQRVCLTSECLKSVGSKLAREFVSVPRKQWCVPSHASKGAQSYNETTREWESLLLIKVPKTASSTMAGVVLRIADETGCSIQWEHRQCYLYTNRSSTSILVGSVRKPISRTLSAIWYYHFSYWNRHNPSDAAIIKSLRTNQGGNSLGKGGFQYDWLSPVELKSDTVTSNDFPGLVKDSHILLQKLQELMSAYTFIVVSERMDESLVALSFVIGVSLTDVLFTSSKVAGAYLYKKQNSGEMGCRRQLEARPTPNIVEYLKSDAFTAMNYADYLLYHAADVSLNLTIQHIGRDKFDKALADFRALKQRVQEACGERLGSGCTSDGKPILPRESCYMRDFGCGYKCINEVLSEIAKINS